MQGDAGSETEVVAAKKPAFDIKTLYSGKILALVAVAVGFTLVTMIIVEATGGAQKFRGFIEGAGAWAPLVYVLLKASTYVIAPLSGTTVKLASGALFGTWEGMLLSLAGDTLGGSLNYWIARTLGRKGVVKFAGKKALNHIDASAERVGGWRALLGARLLLSPIYDFISYAAGLAKISFTQYVVVTTVGGIPVSLLFAVMGNATATNKLVGYIVLGATAVSLVGLGIMYLVQRKQSDKRQ